MKYKVYDNKTGEEIEVSDREELCLSSDGVVSLYYNDGSGGWSWDVLDDVTVEVV